MSCWLLNVVENLKATVHMGTSKPPSFLVHSNKTELKNEHVKNAVIETAFTIIFFFDLGLDLDLKEREKK